MRLIIQFELSSCAFRMQICSDCIAAPHMSSTPWLETLGGQRYDTGEDPECSGSGHDVNPNSYNTSIRSDAAMIHAEA